MFVFRWELVSGERERRRERERERDVSRKEASVTDQ
jgi:hypothetical protein